MSTSRAWYLEPTTAPPVYPPCEQQLLAIVTLATGWYLLTRAQIDVLSLAIKYARRVV